DSRIYLGGSAFNRALGNSLTNSLLYVDVLIFMAYLEDRASVKAHAEQLEYLTINIAFHALSSKKNHDRDAKLIQILDASLTYVELGDAKFDHSHLDLLDNNFTPYEKDYFLDMACLTIWEDKMVDPSESNYIFTLGRALGKTREEVAIELGKVKRFFDTNKDRISYLKDKNLAVQFYAGMSKNVRKLILRNSKRLKRELEQSRELVTL